MTIPIVRVVATKVRMSPRLGAVISAMPSASMNWGRKAEQFTQAGVVILGIQFAELMPRLSPWR